MLPRAVQYAVLIDGLHIPSRQAAGRASRRHAVTASYLMRIDESDIGDYPGVLKATAARPWPVQGIEMLTGQAFNSR
jgi:hypothetical protein